MKTLMIMAVFVACAGCSDVSGSAARPRDFFGGKKPLVVEAGPAESLVAVRDKVRAMSAGEKADGVEVRLAPGRYVLDKELALGPEDSGAPGAPIVWRGAPGGGTCLTAGRDVPAELFKPDPAHPGVMVADVSAWKLEWPKPPRSECREPYPIPEIYVDGERYEPAGWPDWPTVAAPGDTNGGWTVITSFPDMGTRSGTGSVGDAGKRFKVEKPRGGTFGYEGDRPSRWTNAKSVLLHGFWCFDWAESKIPVKSINAESNTITLAYQHSYGVRKGNPSPRRWRAMNLLEELDRPGECFVDMETSRIYIMPRRPLSVASRVTITWAQRSIVSIRGAHDFAVADMELFGSWTHAVYAMGVTNAVFDGLAVHGVRLRGFDMHKAQNTTVSACDVHDVGNGGVYVDGGDRRTLTRGENVVEDCLVRSFSKNRLTSAYAIHMAGCGNTARHNEMFDAPHQAASLYGNDNLFEYNVVSNVLQCTDDAGAYYTGRNPSCRGNMLRYNLFADIGSNRGHGNAAVYFDDGDGGNEVFGCVFRRCGAPGRGSFGTVFCHGGYSNVVRNCLFIDCERPLGSSPWKQKRWEEFLKEGYMVSRIKKEVDIESPTFLARYPELNGYLPGQADDLRWNAAFDNVFVNAREIMKGRWTTNETDVAAASLPPGDANAACRSLLPSFRPIPYEKIGRRR
jgi:hypothetical protein